MKIYYQICNVRKPYRLVFLLASNHYFFPIIFCFGLLQKIYEKYCK